MSKSSDRHEDDSLCETVEVSPKRADSTGAYENTWTHIQATEILYVSRHYIVYVDKSGELQWETTKEFDENTEPGYSAYRHDKMNYFVVEAAVLDAKIPDELPDYAT